MMHTLFLIMLARDNERGGPRVIFECFAHMKVLFIVEQPHFMEWRYLARSESY